MLTLLPLSSLFVPLLVATPPSPSAVDVEPDRVAPPKAGVVTHLAAGPWFAEPTDHEPGSVSPGLATELDVGVQRGSWLWLGAVGGWGFYPSRDFSAHQLTAGGFVGVRPKIGPLWLATRIGASAGMAYGRSSVDLVGRPVVTGQFRVGLESRAATAERVRFGFYLGLDVG